MKKPFLIAALTALLPLSGAFAALPAYVSQDSLDQIIKVNADGSTSTYYNGGPGNVANGLAFDKGGGLFTNSYIDGTITKIEPNGPSSVFATLPPDPLYGGPFPQAMAFDNAGNLFVTNGYNIIWKYTPSGVGSVFADLTNSEPGGTDATGLAFDSLGNLFVSDSYTGDIFKIAPDGTIDPTPYANVGGAAQLAFDADGNLFVSDYVSSIWKIFQNGTVQEWATGLNHPWGLAFDQNGVLWGTEYGTGVADGKIDTFGTNGEPTTVVDNVQSPDYIAFPVPEPSTYALCGLGALAVMAAYRRKLALARA